MLEASLVNIQRGDHVIDEECQGLLDKSREWPSYNSVHPYVTPVPRYVPEFKSNYLSKPYVDEPKSHVIADHFDSVWPTKQGYSLINQDELYSLPLSKATVETQTEAPIANGVTVGTQHNATTARSDAAVQHVDGSTMFQGLSPLLTLQRAESDRFLEETLAEACGKVSVEYDDDFEEYIPSVLNLRETLEACRANIQICKSIFDSESIAKELCSTDTTTSCEQSEYSEIEEDINESSETQSVSPKSDSDYESSHARVYTALSITHASSSQDEPQPLKIDTSEVSLRSCEEISEKSAEQISVARSLDEELAMKEMDDMDDYFVINRNELPFVYIPHLH